MTYYDFESQATDAARLARLRLHLDEVRGAITAGRSVSISSDGKSWTKEDLSSVYLPGLMTRLRELENKPGILGRAPVSLINRNQ